MDIKFDLDLLPETYLNQELYLIDFILVQIPYNESNSFEIMMEDINKEIFRNSHTDEMLRILEIFDRFARLKILAQCKGTFHNNWVFDITYEKNTLLEYKKRLISQLDEITNQTNKIFAQIDGRTLSINFNSNHPIHLSFREDKKIHQSFTLLKILFDYWKERFYAKQLDPRSHCLVPRNHILSELKKQNLGEYDNNRLNNAVTNLKKAMKSFQKAENHIYLDYNKSDDSLIFGISQTSYLS